MPQQSLLLVSQRQMPLVFREMWDTTDLHQRPQGLTEAKGKSLCLDGVVPLSGFSP